MATYIRPTQLEEKMVIRQFAMKWLTSARVENLLTRKANKDLLHTYRALPPTHTPRGRLHVDE